MFIIRAPGFGTTDRATGIYTHSQKPNGHVINEKDEWDHILRRAKLFSTAIEAADYYRDVIVPTNTTFRKTATIYIVEVSVKTIIDKAGKAPTMTL